MSCKSKKCKEIEIVECSEELCDFEFPAICTTVDSTDFEFFNESDGLVDVQVILEELDALLAQGFSGTVLNPTSITCLNGIITDMS